MLLTQGNSPMYKIDQIKENVRRQIERHPLLILILISLLIQLVYLSFRFPLWWDSHVYVGMGKFLASQGEAGIFEIFRPPLLPLILGGLWKVGFNLLVAGSILDIFFSLMVTILTWKIGTKLFNQNVGFYAGFLVCLNPIFLIHTGLILTEPLAMFLALIAIYLVVTEKSGGISYGRFFTIGIITALSFLAKFPQGLLLPAIIFTIVISKKSTSLKIKQSASVTGGFLLLIIPYLWINYSYFNDPLAPLKTGSWMVTTATWLYGEGITYYISHFFLLSPVFFLFFAYIWYFVREKRDFKEKFESRSFVLVVFSILIIVYFLTVPRKEPRYLVTIVPALAILSVAVVEKWYYSLKRMEKPILYPSALIVISIIGTLIFVPQVLLLDSSTDSSPEIKQILEEYGTTKAILTNDPSPASLTDNRIILFGGMETAMAAYEAYATESGLIMVNDCSFICSLNDTVCEIEKELLLKRIREENQQIFHKTVKDCAIEVYEPLKDKPLEDNRSLRDTQ